MQVDSYSTEEDTPLLKVFVFTTHASLQRNIDFCLEKGIARVMEVDQRKKKIELRANNSLSSDW